MSTSDSTVIGLQALPKSLQGTQADGIWYVRHSLAENNSGGTFSLAAFEPNFVGELGPTNRVRAYKIMGLSVEQTGSLPAAERIWNVTLAGKESFEFLAGSFAVDYRSMLLKAPVSGSGFMTLEGQGGSPGAQAREWGWSVPYPFDNTNRWNLELEGVNSDEGTQTLRAWGLYVATGGGKPTHEMPYDLIYPYIG